jgi:capsular exopolysaccharide synthesis family protein
MSPESDDGDGSPSQLAVSGMQRILASAQETMGTWGSPEEADLSNPGGMGSGLRILEFIRIFYKSKWLIAAVVAVALTVGVADTLLTRPIYSAGTTIEIDRETANVVGLQDVQPVEQIEHDAEFLQTQYGLLKSRSLAERVAQSLGLANDDGFLVGMGAIRKGQSIPAAAGPAQQEARRLRVVDILLRNLGIHPTLDSRLVAITFDSPDPALAAKIADAFAENFIQSSLERRYEASAYARNFLQTRLVQLKTRLEDSERQLVAYAIQKQIIHVTEGSAGKDEAPSQSLAATNLGAFDTQLTNIRASRIEAEQKWHEAESVSGLAIPEVLADPTVQSLRQDKVKLISQYVDLLKIYKPDYPQMLQLKAQMADVDQQLNLAAETIRRALKTQYESALKQEAALQNAVTGLTASVLDVRSREIRYNILQREVDTNRALYDGLLQRYKEIGVAGGITTNNISIVDHAEAPTLPSKPRPIYNMAVAATFGLALGVLLAFILETLDHAIRKPADLESKLGLPVLGGVPLLERGLQPMEALADLRSPLSEAYHSIRSTLGFTTSEGAPRILAITSARPGEGKTTTAIALALGFSRLGMKVLLMDLDLRNPGVHKTVGADNRVGASNLLAGGVGFTDAIQITKWPNFFVIPSGPLPPSPAELLAGSRLGVLTKEALDAFDMVILDAPPVMGLADAPLIAAAALGTILAVEAGRTTRGQARAAVRRLRMANARLVGAVLTKFDAKSATYGYGYSYAYAYDYDYSYGRKKLGEAGSVARLGRRQKPRRTAAE